MRPVLGLPSIPAGVSILFFGLVAAAGFGVWLDLNEGQRALVSSIIGDHLLLLGVLVLLAVIGPGILLGVLLRPYVSVPRRMAEETWIIAAANPAHRLSAAGPGTFRDLADAINKLAAGFQSLKDDVEARIAAAKTGSEEEKNRLAALMAQLTQSVIVCNIDGQILLYNNSARQLLSPSTRSGSAGLIGLGRSIFPFVERNLISHALENVRSRLRQGSPNPVVSFVTTTRAGQLIRAQMGPVAGMEPASAVRSDAMPATEITGFVLTLEDVTQRVETANRVDALIQSLIGGSRASLANVRAAAEAMLTYPDMESAQQQKFISIINDEAGASSARLDQTAAEYTGSLQTRSPLEDMLGADLIAAVQRRIENKLGVRTRTETVEQPVWINVDSYSLMQAVTYLASRLKYELEVREIAFRLAQAGRFAHLDLLWTGAPIEAETLRAWENQPLRMGGEASSLTLREVMQRHGGEIWHQAESASQAAYFRLLVPLAHHEDQASGAQGRGEEQYDLDLFRQPGQTVDLGERLLTDLSCTAFQIWTTGPKAAEGDDIISIGAVRIVNGRLLRDEVLEQLIDPQRPMSDQAAKLHGIEPSMLDGQPTVEKVLPAFHRFCTETIFVAHDGASALSFLRRLEARTGTRFAHPLLDTMLLSAVVHPTFGGHTLDAVAERLGVRRAAGSTTLDHAIAIGEVFLKLIPLLAGAGITTLQDALDASRSAYRPRQS